MSSLLLVAIATSAPAQSRGGHGGSGHHSSGGVKPGVNPVTINPSPGSGHSPWCPPLYRSGGLPYYVGGWGTWASYPVAYPVAYTVVVGQGTRSYPLLPTSPLTGFAPPVMPLARQPAANPAAAVAQPAAPRNRNRDAARSKEMIELGDRLFRAGNLGRAVERYEQAIRADLDRAEPRARLAQVALVRGKYHEAANKLREAQTAEPGWLATAGDVQALYPEPAVYAKHVAKLEAHLQAHPEDRDGWLVLGALWYLSGRTQKSADVFLRLSDRREDPTLRAFLQAAKVDMPKE